MKIRMIKKCKCNFVMFFLTMFVIASCIIPIKVYAEQKPVEQVFFFGDDAGVGLEVASANDSTKMWYCERGKGLTWLKTQFDKVREFKSGAVVVAAGFSECSNTLKAKEYASYLNEKVEELKKRGEMFFCYVNVTPVDEQKYGLALNSKIELWNSYMRNNLNKDIVYIDAYSLVKKNLQTKNDGYHLVEDLYRMIYEHVIHTIGLKTAEEIAQDRLNEANAKKEVKAINGWGIDKQGEPVYYDSNQNIVTGWQEIEGGKYYFDKYGHYLKGLQEIDGKTYFFNTIGLMSRGLVKIEDGKYSIFGDDGVRLEKWQKYAGERYYINKDGYCLNGWWLIGTRTYYFKEDGAVAVGLTQIDNETYYFDKDGGVRVGWQTIDGDKYYFKDGGAMAVGKYELDGQCYYFFAEGGIATGWNTENDGVRYYTSDGIMITGFHEIEGDGYFFAEGGLMQTGWYDFAEGKRLFTPTGKMTKGLYTDSESTYYFDEETGYMKTGWVIVDGQKTYFGEDGKLGSGWTKIGEKKYYLNKSGRITKNLANSDGKIYFFNSSGAVVFSLPIWAIVICVLAIFVKCMSSYIKKNPTFKEKLMKLINPSVNKKDNSDNTLYTSEYDDEEIIEDGY